ncbi:MAG: GAF domain-containing protein [Actinobacteria bacterium]|nr:GAF domain-containing protein [Actinomycetota bacterium]
MEGTRFMDECKKDPKKEALSQSCFEQLPVGVAFFDAAEKLETYNRAWEEFWQGYVAEAEPGRDLIIQPGMTLEELVPMDGKSARDMKNKVAEEGYARQDVLIGAPDGRRLYYEVIVSPVFEDGEYVGAVNLVADASQRLGSLEELEEHIMMHSGEAERRRVVADGLGEALAMINSNRPLDEALNFIVDRAGKVLGTEAVALHRIQLQDGLIIPDAQIGKVARYIADLKIPLYGGAVGEAILARQSLVVPDSSALMENARRAMPPDQQQLVEKLVSRYPSILGIPVVVKDEDYGVLVFYYPEAREFTEEDVELARAFADQVALAEGNARLREIVELTAIADERNRLARELHDAVTQTLFSASMIAEVIPALWDRDEVEGRKRLEELRILTRGALAEMRTLLLELRPAVLEETELDDLLRQLSEAASGSTRVPVKLEFSGRCELPVDTKIAIYRIAQEALNNISKYAGASNVALTMDCTPETVNLTIHDDGRGFSGADGASDSFGLKIMQERAESIGAELVIDSTMGEGTRIDLSWASDSGDSRERTGNG